MTIKHIKEVTVIENTVLKLKSSLFRKFHHELHRKYSSSTPLVVNIIAQHYQKNAGPITIGELADRTNLTPAAISQILNPLEEHKMIRREKNVLDRRHTYITITGKGKFMLRRYNNHQGHTQVVDEMLDYLGEKDSAEFVRLCGRIDDFLESREEKPKAGSLDA